MVAASGTPLTDLRVDGGASVMDLLLQFQADQLGVTVRRPRDQETTALGAAYLAGLAEGVWPDLAAVGAAVGARTPRSTPAPDRTAADAAYASGSAPSSAPAPGPPPEPRPAASVDPSVACAGRCLRAGHPRRETPGGDENTRVERDRAGYPAAASAARTRA